MCSSGMLRVFKWDVTCVQMGCYVCSSGMLCVFKWGVMCAQIECYEYSSALPHTKFCVLSSVVMS